MKKILPACCLVLVSCAATAADGIEGGWKTVEVVVEGGPNPLNITGTQVQPSVYMFGKTHYAIVATIGSAPPKKFAGEPTQAEKAAAYDSLGAHAGTYELSGEKLTLHRMASKDPNQMGAAEVRQLKVSGEEMAMSWKGDNGATIHLTLHKLE